MDYMHGLTDMDCGLYRWTADFDLSRRCPVTGVHGTTPVAGRRSGRPWIWLDSHPSRRWMGCPVRHWTARVTSCHWPGRPLPLHPDEALRRGATAENVELFFHP